VTDTAERPDVVRPPRTIVLAFAVTIAHVVLSIGNSAMLWGFQDYLRRQLLDSNRKAKKPKDYSDTAQGLHNLNHDLHGGLTAGLVQMIVFSLLVMLLAVSFRKGRNWGRWAEILVLIIVVQAPFRLLNLGGDAPALMRVVSALVGLTGLAVIVLLVVPESSRYFVAVRGTTAGARASGGPLTGLRGLFGPRTSPADPVDTPAGSGRSTPSGPRSEAAQPKRAVPPPKAKARTGSEASEGQPSPPRPAAGLAGKSRGKSRRGS
jgi:hypothetical protein